MFCLILAILLQIQPIPDPLPNGDVVGGPLESIREWIEARNATEDVRYHGIRSMLQEIRDRPQVDNSPLFPRINAAIEAAQEARREAIELRGEIRPLKNLASLAWALVWLVGLLIAFSVYDRFFPHKAA